MDKLKKPSRRKVLKTGLASLATAGVMTQKGHAALKPKAPGETKVVAIMGDYWHSPIAQEFHVRDIFSSLKDWRVYFVRASRFLTKELLSDTDLLITGRYSGADAMGWSTDGIVDAVPPRNNDRYMTKEHEEAIYDNIVNRGMGYLAVHASIQVQNKTINDLMNIDRDIQHMQIQPIVVRDLNQDHPITRGIKPFFINLDEQFDGRFKESHSATVLFYTEAVHDKRVSKGGWCSEQGNGRVVNLMPGHTQWPYRVPNYQEIFWRAAHWALKREIPPYSPGRYPGDFKQS